MLVAVFLVFAECYPDPPRYPVVHIKHTVNREIFVVKIFSWVGPVQSRKLNTRKFLTTKICKHVYVELRVVCCKFMLKSLAAAQTLSAWSYCLASDSE